MTGTYRRRTAATAALLASIAMSVVAVGDAHAASPKKVNCNNDGNLQTALNAGGTVDVSGTCSGTFTIDKNVTIEGSPSAVISGAQGNAPVLTIAPSLKVSMSHVSVENGVGGISVGDSAHLTLSHVTVSHNTQYEDGGAGIFTDDNAVVSASYCTFSFNIDTLSNNTDVNLHGGAIYSAGSVTVAHSQFTDNSLDAESTQSTAFGGAIFAAGNLTVTDSAFARNKAAATTAEGGSIYTSGGAMTIKNTTFTDDRASGNNPTVSQTVEGGSIYSEASKNRLAGVRVTGSHAEAQGTSDIMASGGALWAANPVSIASGAFTSDAAIATVTSGSGQADASGGALLLPQGATASIRHTTLNADSVVGSAPGGNTIVEGGAMFATGRVSISASTISHSHATARSGTAATASGGGLAFLSASPISLTNSTVVGNVATATLASGAQAGATATAGGGGIADATAKLTLSYDTIADNSAGGSGSASGGGVEAFTTFPGAAKPTSLATIWSGNVATTGAQCSGGVTSAGYNLFAGITGCPTTLKKSDRNHAKAGLGKLAANGGPTKTLALGKHSAALDRIPRATCRKVVTTDERGTARPQGAQKKASHRRCDIGAYEKTVHH